MTRQHTATVREQMLEEASHWVTRLDRGLTEAEKLAFDEFLSEEEARALFLELAGLSDRLNVLAELAPAPEARRVARPPTSRRYGLAAGLLLAVLLGLAYFSGAIAPGVWPTSAPPVVVYETRVGERSTIKLQDGSEVALNTDSQVRVVFTESGRLAILDRGEAHFDVALDSYRPFSVRSGLYIVQVVGTSFSVYQARAGVTEVVVKEGNVRVDTTTDTKTTSSVDALSPPSLMNGGSELHQGEIGVFTDAGASIFAVDESTLDARLAWRDGRLVFQGETLEAALADISRYTPIRFRFLDEEAKGIHVAGVFRSGDVDGLLQTLSTNFDIAYQRLADDIILISTR